VAGHNLGGRCGIVAPLNQHWEDSSTIPEDVIRFVLICARVSPTGTPEREPVKQLRLIKTGSG